jgi:SAM-dependent methyltransferase
MMTDDDVSHMRTTDVMPRPVPHQREFWDRWHRDHDHASHRQHAKEVRAEFQSALGDVGSKRVLEIGCGQGRDAIAFAQAGLSVVALDHSSVAIERAKTSYNNLRRSMPDPEAIRVSWLQRDYGEHGVFLDDKPFDAVFSHLSLHYFDDKTTRRLFEDIRLALRPGGLLFFTARSRDDALSKEGDPLDGDEDHRCHQGHVRRFFSEVYTRDLLSNWSHVQLRTHVVKDSRINPGTFIRCTARRLYEGSR